MSQQLSDWLNDQQQRESTISQDLNLEDKGAEPFIHLGLSLFALLVIAFVVWSMYALLDETAVSQGEVITSGTVQAVQHLEGGIIAELAVSEGQIVQSGQTLLRFDDATPKAELERMRSRQITLQLQEERLRSLLDNRAADFSFAKADYAQLSQDQNAVLEALKIAQNNEKRVLERKVQTHRSEIKALKQEKTNKATEADLYQQEVSMHAKLSQSGDGAKLPLLEAKQNLAKTQSEHDRLDGRIQTLRATIRETEQQIKELDSRQRSSIAQELGEVTAELAELNRQITSLEDRVQRLLVATPVDGVVQHLPVSTIRGVVPPGGVVAEIVPVDDELQVRIEITTQDIGFVKPGLAVQVKIQTYNFARYGIVKGQLKKISATTFMKEDGAPYYKGIVSLENNYVGTNPNNLILPGMTVTADIITGSKTLFEYLLKPIYTNLQQAFRER